MLERFGVGRSQGPVWNWMATSRKHVATRDCALRRYQYHCNHDRPNQAFDGRTSAQEVLDYTVPTVISCCYPNVSPSQSRCLSPISVRL